MSSGVEDGDAIQLLSSPYDQQDFFDTLLDQPRSSQPPSSPPSSHYSPSQVSSSSPLKRKRGEGYDDSDGLSSSSPLVSSGRVMGGSGGGGVGGSGNGGGGVGTRVSSWGDAGFTTTSHCRHSGCPWSLDAANLEEENVVDHEQSVEAHRDHIATEGENCTVCLQFVSGGVWSEAVLLQQLPDGGSVGDSSDGERGSKRARRSDETAEPSPTLRAASPGRRTRVVPSLALGLPGYSGAFSYPTQTLEDAGLPTVTTSTAAAAAGSSGGPTAASSLIGNASFSVETTNIGATAQARVTRSQTSSLFTRSATTNGGIIGDEEGHSGVMASTTAAAGSGSRSGNGTANGLDFPEQEEVDSSSLISWHTRQSSTTWSAGSVSAELKALKQEVDCSSTQQASTNQDMLSLVESAKSKLAMLISATKGLRPGELQARLAANSAAAERARAATSGSDGGGYGGPMGLLSGQGHRCTVHTNGTVHTTAAAAAVAANAAHALNKFGIAEAGSLSLSTAVDAMSATSGSANGTSPPSLPQTSVSHLGLGSVERGGGGGGVRVGVGSVGGGGVSGDGGGSGGGVGGGGHSALPELGATVLSTAELLGLSSQNGDERYDAPSPVLVGAAARRSVAASGTRSDSPTTLIPTVTTNSQGGGMGGASGGGGGGGGSGDGEEPVPLTLMPTESGLGDALDPPDSPLSLASSPTRANSQSLSQPGSTIGGSTSSFSLWPYSTQ